MDVDRLSLAGQLDDVVIGLRRVTLDRQGLSLTAAATLTTLRRSGPSRLTDLAAGEGVTQPSMTALVARLADQGLVQRRTDPAARLAGPLEQLADDDVRASSAALPALARLAGAFRIPAPTGGST